MLTISLEATFPSGLVRKDIMHLEKADYVIFAVVALFALYLIAQIIRVWV